MRESKDKLVKQLGQANDALAEVFQKTTELNDVHRFINQNESMKIVDPFTKKEWYKVRFIHDFPVTWFEFL